MLRSGASARNSDHDGSERSRSPATEVGGGLKVSLQTFFNQLEAEMKYCGIDLHSNNSGWWFKGRRSLQLSVHLAPVADLDHQDAQGAVLDTADDAAIAHPVLPELTQPGTLEGLTNAARIIQHRHAAVQESQDSPGILRVKLAEFAHGGGV